MPGIDRIGTPFPALLAAAQQGDAGAIGTVWEAYSPVVAGYARLEGAPDPDDLTSEVFLGALRALGNFRGDEEQFRSWLFTLAYRRIIDERRHRSRRPEELVSDPELPPSAGRPGRGPSAESTALDQLRTERVVELCQQLVPAQRDVLVLRLVAALTVGEVADLTERTPGGVKALQRRGLSALSKILEREGVPR